MTKIRPLLPKFTHQSLEATFAELSPSLSLSIEQCEEGVVCIMKYEGNNVCLLYNCTDLYKIIDFLLVDKGREGLIKCY